MKTKPKKASAKLPKSYFTQWNGYHDASCKRLVIPVKVGTTYPELLSMMRKGAKEFAKYKEPYIMYELRYEFDDRTFGNKCTY